MSSSIPPATSAAPAPVTPPGKVAPVGGVVKAAASNIGPAVSVSLSNTAHLTDSDSVSDQS